MAALLAILTAGSPSPKHRRIISGFHDLVGFSGGPTGASTHRGLFLVRTSTLYRGPMIAKKTAISPPLGSRQQSSGLFRRAGLLLADPTGDDHGRSRTRAETNAQDEDVHAKVKAAGGRKFSTY